MRISVIIPVYNRANMVLSTLKSFLEQTYRPFQIILVDNGSTDNTLQVLNLFKAEYENETLRIDVVSERERGACAARNRGAEYAVGEWLMFFDSDDLLELYAIEEYIKRIDATDDNVDVICTRIEFDNNGKVFTPYFPKSDFLKHHIFHSCLSTQRYIVKKSFYKKSEGWNNNVKCWNDWELGIRILLLNPTIDANINKVCVRVIVHNDSITGPDFVSNSAAREFAIDCAEKSIRESGVKLKSRYLKYLDARRVTLAALYKKDGRSDLASDLYEKTYRNMSKGLSMKILMPFIYRYVAAGGKGGSWIIKSLIK